MTTLPAAMVEAFQWLEDNYSPKWRSGNGSKENLLKAFSQNKVSKADFLGYAGSDGIRHAFGRAIPEHNKPKNMHWENWLLDNIGKFQCYSCEEVLPILEKVPGKYFCKSCDSVSTYIKRDDRSHYVLNYLINSNGCIDCGEKDPVVLEFDHVDPSTKSFNIGDGYSSKPLKAIKEELEKCEIVCANCHRRRTAKTYNHFRFVQTQGTLV